MLFRSDHLIRGYFAWLGAFVIAGPDMLARQLADEPTQPATDAFKLISGGMVAKTESSSSRYVAQVYEQAKELDRAYATYRELLKREEYDRADRYLEENEDKLIRQKEVKRVKDALQKQNARIREIERSRTMTAAEKRVAINEIKKEQNRIAQTIFQLSSQ